MLGSIFMGRTSDAREKLMEAAVALVWSGSYGGTSVDDICERAGVRKGSFYHFFESKADLAIAGMETAWQKRREELDHIFSPVNPPLERIRRACEGMVAKQREIKDTTGRVLGCPLHSLGSEISTWEETLRTKIRDTLAQYHRYFESALRDAHAAGEVSCADAAAKARMVMAYCEGLMTQARILNDISVLEEMPDGAAMIARSGPAV